MTELAKPDAVAEAKRAGFICHLATTGGWISAACFALIALLVLGQVGLNALNSASSLFGTTRGSLQIPAYSEFTGYLFAAGSFLAFAYAFHHGAHIRVELLVSRLQTSRQRICHLWALFIAAVVSGGFAWFLLDLVLESHKYNDTSMGLIPVPIWIPQVPLFVGMCLLTLVVGKVWYDVLTATGGPVRSGVFWAQSACFLGVAVAADFFAGFDAVAAIRSVTRNSSLVWVSLAVGGGLFAVLAGGLWVAFSLLVSGIIGLFFFSGTQVGSNLALQSWGATNSWSLAALPLFIWMGEILFRSRVSEDLFDGLAPVLRWLPGGLAHVGILGSGIFAAISGSSAATAATIGKVTIPRLLERGYDERLVVGIVAGSGTLGLLIPPSIILIVYGVATEQSISRLFAAGILPGLLLIGLFMGYTGLKTMSLGKGRPKSAHSEPIKLASTLRLLPIIFIIGSIFLVIYAGWASPTDAAAIGVFFSLLFAILTDRREGRTGFAIYIEGLLGAVKTSAMIVLIFVGANFLTVSMGYTGIPRELALWIDALDLTPAQLLIALTIFFAIAGCFLDGVSIVLLTTAVLVPMVEQAGFDLIWFGIYLVVVVEMSQITPPVGFNLFVLQNLTGHDIVYIARAALPFFVLMMIAVVLIYIFPGIVMTLPNSMN